jgi:hypothetical protein
MRISEIFHCIQGDGELAGVPSVLQPADPLRRHHRRRTRL